MDLSPTEIKNELAWRRSTRDIDWFAENFWTIQHPERGRIKFDLRDAQVETLDAFLTRRRIIILKARQVGFSTLSSLYVYWRAFFQPDQQIVMLSKGERESVELLAKVKYGIKGLPDWMKDRGPQIVQETQSKIVFDNGSVIESLPSKSDPARGRSVSVVIVDEWAFLENPAEAWASIEPIADIGGQVIGLSTANGSGTFFEEMWIKADTGASDFFPIFFSWEAVPERDALWYESKKRDLLPWQLAQEYPSNPEEAFIRSGNPVFDIDSLRAMDTQPPKRGQLRSSSATSAEFMRNEKGSLQIWQFPQHGHVYCVGADVAEGLEHGDYSVAWVVDAKTGECVAKWRDHVPPDIFGSVILPQIGYFYNAALIAPEVNNHGYSTCVNLRDTSYPHVYYRHTYDERQDKKGRKIGWRTQANTKPLMIDELARALREDLRLLDKETVAELVTFTRDHNGKMSGSPFDDQVIALAIANQMRKHVFSTEYYRPQDVEGTVMGEIEKLISGGRRGSRTPVGRNNVRGTLPLY